MVVKITDLDDNRDDVSEEKKKEERPLIKARDTPSPFIALLYGFQQVMVCVSALLTVPFLLAEELCPGQDIAKLRYELISSMFVSSGLSTIIQTWFGLRLALLQGTAFAYVPSVQVFMKMYHCNATDSTYVDPSEYHAKLGLVQGCLIVSAMIPILIGLTGLVGMFTKFVGPLTVSTLMLLLAFSQADTMVKKMSGHWVAIVQAITLFATILYLAEVKVPVPGIKNWKIKWYRVNVFGQYPYLIAILTSWAFCGFLTITNLAAPESEARVDKNRSLAVIREAPWFAVPYPGKYAALNFNTGLFIAFLCSALTSVLESVGDYHAAARVSQERAPPSHAINRGILAEGLGSLISGLLGPGVGMTTHTENIGVIGITRVASRWTMIVAAFILIFLGVFTKVGAILSTLPDPLVGGVLASSMAMVVGVATSNLLTVDMTLSRNMAIFGFSMMTGLIVPIYFNKHPIRTGLTTLDQVFEVVLTLQMLVGAVTACILDNTVPGATREQRGLRSRGTSHDIALEDDVYSYPPLVMKILNYIPFVQYLPCMPKEKKLRNGRVKASELTNGEYDNDLRL